MQYSLVAEKQPLTWFKFENLGVFVTTVYVFSLCYLIRLASCHLNLSRHLDAPELEEPFTLDMRSMVKGQVTSVDQWAEHWKILECLCWWTLYLEIQNSIWCRPMSKHMNPKILEIPIQGFEKKKMNSNSIHMLDQLYSFLHALVIFQAVYSFNQM